MSVMLVLPITRSGVVLSASRGPFAHGQGREGTLGTAYGPKTGSGIRPRFPGRFRLTDGLQEGWQPTSATLGATVGRHLSVATHSGRFPPRRPCPPRPSYAARW